MAHELVKFYTDEDGEPMLPYWHFVQNIDARRSLCGGLVFGYGEGSAEYVTKVRDRGGITCPACLGMIKQLKTVRL